MPEPHKQTKPQNTKKTLKRILQYMKQYKGRLIIVVISILISSLAATAGSYFLKPLINDYIVPFIGQQNPDLGGFIRMLCLMVAIYIIGVVATYA